MSFLNVNQKHVLKLLTFYICAVVSNLLLDTLTDRHILILYHIIQGMSLEDIEDMYSKDKKDSPIQEKV